MQPADLSPLYSAFFVYLSIVMCGYGHIVSMATSSRHRRVSVYTCTSTSPFVHAFTRPLISVFHNSVALVLPNHSACNRGNSFQLCFVRRLFELRWYCYSLLLEILSLYEIRIVPTGLEMYEDVGCCGKCSSPQAGHQGTRSWGPRLKRAISPPTHFTCPVSIGNSSIALLVPRISNTQVSLQGNLYA